MSAHPNMNRIRLQRLLVLQSISLSLLVLTSFNAFGADRSLSCKIKFPQSFAHPQDYEQLNGYLQIVETDGKVSEFTFQTQVGHWPCSVDVTADKTTRPWDQSKWRYTTKETKVSLEKGYAVIDKSSNYRVRFFDLDRNYYCGMNGLLVDEVILTPGEKLCRVK